MIENQPGPERERDEIESPALANEVGQPRSGIEYIGNEPVKGPLIGGVDTARDLLGDSENGDGDASGDASARNGDETDESGEGSASTDTAPPEEDADAPQWYVVHCYSGYENKVKHNLEQRVESMGMQTEILQVVVPTEEEMEVRDGKRRTVEKRVFPGYILVKMKLNERVLNIVRATPGVTRFVGMGNKPTALTQQEVNQIMRRMEAEAPKLRVSFRTGQKVRITDGPFADFMGLVDKIDTERAKVTVLVSFFGRETPVELDFLQVERM